MQAGKRGGGQVSRYALTLPRPFLLGSVGRILGLGWAAGVTAAAAEVKEGEFSGPALSVARTVGRSLFG